MPVRSQPKILGGAKYFDFKRLTFGMEYYLSKHKTTRYGRNVLGAWPFSPLATPMTWSAFLIDENNNKKISITFTPYFNCNWAEMDSVWNVTHDNDSDKNVVISFLDKVLPYRKKYTFQNQAAATFVNCAPV